MKIFPQIFLTVPAPRPLLWSYNFLTGGRPYETTKLSSKGQVIIPKELRTRRRWEPGLELETIETDEGVLLKPVSAFSVTSLREVTSSLAYSGKSKSLKEMEEAIKKGAEVENVTGVDTNIIVRLLTHDDPGQAAKADAAIQKDHLFISDTVLLETEWVLRYAYGFSPTAFMRHFSNYAVCLTLALPTQIALRRSCCGIPRDGFC